MAGKLTRVYAGVLHVNVSTPRNILLTGGPGGGIRRQGCALSCATDTVLRPLPPSHSQLHTMGSQGTFPLLASATPYRRKTALPHGMLLALFDALGRWDPNSKPPDHGSIRRCLAARLGGILGGAHPLFCVQQSPTFLHAWQV